MCPGYHHNDFVVTYVLLLTVYNVPKCMSYYKAIAVITGRVQWF